MNLVICAVKDLAADAFNRPIFVQSVGIALRSFGDEVMREAIDNAMNAHPEHFVLYKLGEFDDATGLFHTAAPEQLSLAVDYKPIEVPTLRPVK